MIHIRHPEPISRPFINYAVYAVSAVFESVSWWFGWKAFRRVSGTGLLDAVSATKDPTNLMVLFEDSAASSASPSRPRRPRFR